VPVVFFGWSALQFKCVLQVAFLLGQTGLAVIPFAPELSAITVTWHLAFWP